MCFPRGRARSRSMARARHRGVDPRRRSRCATVRTPRLCDRIKKSRSASSSSDSRARETGGSCARAWMNFRIIPPAAVAWGPIRDRALWNRTQDARSRELVCGRRAHDADGGCANGTLTFCALSCAAQRRLAKFQRVVRPPTLISDIEMRRIVFGTAFRCRATATRRNAVLTQQPASSTDAASCCRVPLWLSRPRITHVGAVPGNFRVAATTWATLRSCRADRCHSHIVWYLNSKHDAYDR